MKLNSLTINFKGYDALPLKAVHIDSHTSHEIQEELNQIAQEENFEIRSGLDYYKWAQDNKMIIENNKKPFVVANNRVDYSYLEEIKTKYSIHCTTRDLISTGGNSFIGKYPNGEKWMLIGKDELDSKSLDYISNLYKIKKENIIPIPQQYYHLDMFMRPMGFPYVLVDSPSLVHKKFSKMNWKNSAYEYLSLQNGFKNFELERQKNYASHKSVIKALEKAGFIPIEIAGVFGSGINFLNAIVNQNPDGTITYITNGTTCDSAFITQFQEEFEKELRQKMPNIKNVYFVNGSENYKTQNSNYMMDNLAYRGGGIHCMTMEEPNFEIWG